MRKPTILHRDIMTIVEEAAQYGNAVNIRTLQSRLEYPAATIKFAVHGLADGRVGAVDGMRLQHVGRGFYELMEA